jgi:hypothetical protein
LECSWERDCRAIEESRRVGYLYDGRESAMVGVWGSHRWQLRGESKWGEDKKIWQGMGRGMRRDRRQGGTVFVLYVVEE